MRSLELLARNVIVQFIPLACALTRLRPTTDVGLPVLYYGKASYSCFSSRRRMGDEEK